MPWLLLLLVLTVDMAGSVPGTPSWTIQPKSHQLNHCIFISFIRTKNVKNCPSFHQVVSSPFLSLPQCPPKCDQRDSSAAPLLRGAAAVGYRRWTCLHSWSPWIQRAGREEHQSGPSRQQVSNYKLGWIRDSQWQVHNYCQIVNVALIVS